MGCSIEFFSREMCDKQNLEVILKKQGGRVSKMNH